MTAEELAVWVASLIASPVTQFVKKTLGWNGWKALYLFFAISFLLTFTAQYLTTEISLPKFVEDPVAMIESLLAAFMHVMGLATVVYKVFVDQPKGEG